MEKELKTAAELRELINAELRKHDVCDDVQALDVHRVVGEENLTWDTYGLRSSGGSVVDECRRIFADAVASLQQQYDLAPED